MYSALLFLICKLIWNYKFSFTWQFTKSIFCHTLKTSAHMFLLLQKKCVTLHSIFKTSSTWSSYEKSHRTACVSSLSEYFPSATLPQECFWWNFRDAQCCTSTATWTFGAKHTPASAEGTCVSQPTWIPVPEDWEGSWVP